MSNSVPLAIGTTALAGILLHRIWSNDKTSAPLPPSPKSYPLIGHLLSIPQKAEHLAYTKMSKELGSDIISLSAFGMTIVVLNNREDATNLLDKRSAIYSDRTIPVMISEPSLLNWSTFGSLVRYGDRWKMYRRLMSPWLTKSGTVAFRDAQKREAGLFLQRLLKRCSGPVSSTDLESELLLGLGSMLFRSLYGYEVKSINDPFLVRVQALIRFLGEACLPSNFLVNVIPVLRYVPSWFPGAGWKRGAKKWREEKECLLRDTYELATKQKEENRDTIVEYLKQEAIRLGLTQEQTDEYVKQIAITLYAGGTETVGCLNLNGYNFILRPLFIRRTKAVTTLLMFFMAMILYPKVQRKAQQELDLVVGATRLPDFEDQPKLEYVSRVVQETLRWQPVAPIGLPHTCLQNDTYKGYRIPQGSLVIGNVWAMTRDPNVYVDPETFEPDRFLDTSVTDSPYFGWGRRRCPGSHFAESALFVFVASILSTFEISAPKDEYGDDILPSQKMGRGVILHPEVFDFRLTPRSEIRETLIKDFASRAHEQINT